MTGKDTSYEGCARAVAGALHELERALADLAEALVGTDAEVSVQGIRERRRALRMVGEAYSTLDDEEEGEDGERDDVLGVLGVPGTVIAQARVVNAAKDRLKAISKALYDRRRATPVTDDQGRTVVKEVQWMRLILGDLGRPRLNLLAAYRHIPILEERPVRVGYVTANNRATYRRSREELMRMLGRSTREGAGEDIARLKALPPREEFLTHVRNRYENIRANVTFGTSGDKKGGRKMIQARMPILYPRGRSSEAPVITFPGEAAPVASAVHPARMQAEPYLATMMVFRYADPADARE